MKRATCKCNCRGLCPKSVSIHALYEESDRCRSSRTPYLKVSIHALYEESDYSVAGFINPKSFFQSTLSMKRATSHRFSYGLRSWVSIHALYEESDFCAWWYRSTHQRVSIHALYEESDPIFADPLQLARLFQSTLSMKRATCTC